MDDAVHSARTKPEAVRAAVDGLRSLHDGDEALLDVIAFGFLARMPLAALLSEREPSGIFQPRCRAARALGLIHADDVLSAFLRHPRFPVSPVELAGEEAVVNAAARALGANRSLKAFELLNEVAAVRPHLDGAVEALAGYRSTKAIPTLVAALAEDGSRAAAQEGLRAIGPAARPLLLATAYGAQPTTETHRRHRHAALAVLFDIGPPEGAAPALSALIHEEDASIAALACGTVLRFGPADLRGEAESRLAELAFGAPLRLAIEIAAIRKSLPEAIA